MSGITDRKPPRPAPRLGRPLIFCFAEPAVPARRILLALLLLAGCGGSSITGPGPLLQDLPRPLTAAEQQVVNAANHFTFDLFREATRRLPADSNAFLSPLSASFALGMTLNGARDATFDAMRQALRLGAASQSDINAGYRDLIALLLGLDRTTEMRVANAMFARQGLALLPPFVQAGQTYFGAELRTLDFASPAAVSTINDWVSGKTNGRIPRLLDAIAPEEVLFLINAIYFKGRWRVPFDPRDTRPAPFQGADGTTRQVEMMTRVGETLRIGSLPNATAVELLYGNGAFALVALLPNQGVTPAQVLAGLDGPAWAAFTGAIAEGRADLRLPRFRLEYTRSLKDDLTALGMGIAFDPDRADLSGIADVSPERLYLTRVLQKTFVEVNEEGTEAAAATAVGVGVTSLPPQLVFDRPFLFAIRERLSGTVLFLGLINRLG